MGPDSSDIFLPGVVVAGRMLDQAETSDRRIIFHTCCLDERWGSGHLSGIRSSFDDHRNLGTN